VKNLIFDFDGTIADSFETMLSIFEEIAGRPRKLSDQEIKELRGESLKEIVRYLKIKRWQLPRMVFKAKRLVALRMPSINVFDGVPEALKQLSQDGHKMYILSTNGPKNINDFLIQNGLGGYFTKVYGDIGLRSKSSALRKIMRQQKIKAADCIYIGDEVRDVEAAKKAGVTSVSVGWGFNYPKALRQAGPTALAKSPKDLTEILK